MNTVALIALALLGLFATVMLLWAIVDAVSQWRTDAAVELVKKNNLAATKLLLEEHERTLCERDDWHAKALQKQEEAHDKKIAEWGEWHKREVQDAVDKAYDRGRHYGYSCGVIDSHCRVRDEFGHFVPMRLEYKEARNEALRRIRCGEAEAVIRSFKIEGDRRALRTSHKDS